MFTYLTNTHLVPGLHERVAQAAFESSMPIHVHDDPIPEDNDPEFQHYSFASAKAEGYVSIVLRAPYIQDCGEFWEILKELEDPLIIDRSAEENVDVICVYSKNAAECYADIEYARVRYEGLHRSLPGYVVPIMQMSRRVYARARYLRGVTDADQNYA